MGHKKFTPEEIAILKANPYVMEVTEDIIHFSASFKSSFWDRLQNGMKPQDIFRELGIDPNFLGPTRVSGFKGMLKQEVLAGKGFRDLNTCIKFIQLLKDSELRQSMSRRANCWDNAPQESFFGHMKDEIDISGCTTYQEILAVITDWTEYYNNDRYQWDLARLSPREYYQYEMTGVYPINWDTRKK